jgi:flagellar protein FlaF
MQHSAAKAYDSINKAAMSPRQLEAAILNRAAAMLKSVQESWEQADHEERLFNALRYNQRLWSVFQAELSSDESLLPKKLREDLLSISLFIDKRTFELMAMPEREKVTSLVSINQNIAAGLNTVPEKVAEPA